MGDSPLGSVEGIAQLSLKSHEEEEQKKKWESFQNSGPPEISAEEITMYERIGGGCFGNVYRGKCRGLEVAVKRLFRQDVDAKALADFKREVEIMSNLRHPNVLLLMGACTEKGKMALVMELMPKGNLQTLLHDPKVELSLLQRLRIAKETALGMNWLHCSKPTIIHRDLKPSNILIDSQLRVKVCDFGLSALKRSPEEKLQDKGSIPGTPLWMAPEVLQGKPLDEKSDVYSFGIVLWEIYTQEEPFLNINNFAQFKRAICTNEERPTIPKDTHPGLSALMTSSWDKDTEKRPTFGEVISSLEKIVIDIALPDEDGRQFWTKYFNGKDYVKWNDFLLQFSKTLRFPRADSNPHVTCLSALLAKPAPSGAKGEKVVFLEDFGRFLCWFGPLGPVPTDGPTNWSILEKLHSTLTAAFFHGDISKDEAENILSQRESGTYLVRLSTTVQGSYTISKMSKSGKINHQRIDYNPKRGFSIKMTHSNKDPKTVISDLSLAHIISVLSPELNLKIPCPGSKYANLFKTAQCEGYLMDVDDS